MTPIFEFFGVPLHKFHHFQEHFRSRIFSSEFSKFPHKGECNPRGDTKVKGWFDIGIAENEHTIDFSRSGCQGLIWCNRGASVATPFESVVSPQRSILGSVLACLPLYVVCNYLRLL